MCSFIVHIEPATFGTNFSEIGIKIQNVSFMKMHMKSSSAKLLPFCPGEMSQRRVRMDLWLGSKLLCEKCIIMALGFKI